MERPSESGLAPTRTDDALPFENPIDGRYRVTKRLGGGGMGEVYEVEHVRLERRFALKLLRAELAADAELTARFDREARAVATLHSDHVVSIVDSGTLSDGRPYFVMERLLGQDLKQILAENAELPVGRAVNIAIDVCLGLHAAHAAGLVHRDLKPENVFVTRGDDARERCKLLDFGVVKLTEHDHTRPGALLGTARYMAPEQVAHDAQVGPAADLFALGVMIYRCVSGQHPFAADSLERVLFRVMNDTPAPLPAHVPAELAALVAQALSKTPEQRPASALDFARALARFTPEPRQLDGITGWHVDTALSDDTLGGSFTSVDATPALAGQRPRAPSARRLLSALGAAALLIGATLGVDRLLLRGRELGSPAAPVAPARVGPPEPRLSETALAPAPPPSVMLSANVPPPPPATSQASGPRPARPALKVSTTSAPAAAPAPPASAARPESAADATPLNWFDPRNPYGK
jgi:serine/threonine-protein kinase